MVRWLYGNGNWTRVVGSQLGRWATTRALLEGIATRVQMCCRSNGRARERAAKESAVAANRMSGGRDYRTGYDVQEYYSRDGHPLGCGGENPLDQLMAGGAPVLRSYE